MTALDNRIRLAAGFSLLLLALTACGGSDAKEAVDESIDGEVATGALLVPSDIGKAYKSVPGIETLTLMGCLTALDQLEAVPAPIAVEAKYQDPADPQAGVLSGVRSYASVETITDAFDTFQSSLAECKVIKEDGMKLKIVSTNGISNPNADDQASFAAQGTVTSSGEAVPFQLFFTTSRIDNNLIRVATYRLGPGTPPGKLSTLNNIAADRLAVALEN